MDGFIFEVPPVVGVALEVMCGKYGNDEERIKNLKAAGYDVNLVQSCVNALVALFEKYR